MAAWSPEEFVRTVLVGNLKAKAVVVGENFTYGHKAAGTVSTLTAEGRRFGFAVEGVPLAEDSSDGGDVTISSTYIRACVAAGDLVSAGGLTLVASPGDLPGVVAVETGKDGTLWAATLGNEDPPAPGTIVQIKHGKVRH